MRRLAWETELSLLSLAGQVLVYILGIVLARHLGVAGFESYVAAAAAFIVMVSIVPQGLEKYSLKLLPGLLDRQEQGLLHGFLRFSLRRLLLGSAVLGTLVGLIAWHVPGMARETRIAIIISCLSLPAGALVHLALELLTLLGRGVGAVLVFRVMVPGVVLVLVGIAIFRGSELRAPWVIAAWGLSWLLALAMLTGNLRASLPAETLRTGAVEMPDAWASAARPFWLYRIALAALAQGGILLLDALQPSASVVGGFAAALGTATVIKVLATSTGRVYAGRLSLLIAHRDLPGIERLRRERLHWLAVPLLSCGVLALVFAPWLVGLFHPRFVGTGTTALRILVVASAITTALALAPTCLKHLGLHRELFRSVGWAVLLQLLLLVILVPRWEASGAAMAYSIATVFLYVRLAILAEKGLRQLAAPAER